MSKDREDQGSSRGWIFVSYILLALGVVAVAGAAISYRLYFPDGPVWDRMVWGQFGDYFGGLLNPIIAFLALIALLITIHLQRVELIKTSKELRITRENFERQAKLAEIKRLLDALVANLNDNYLLSDRVAGITNERSKRLGTTWNDVFHGGRLEATGTLLERVIPGLGPIFHLLDQIAKYAELYQETARDSLVRTYYFEEFSGLAFDFREQQLIDYRNYPHFGHWAEQIGADDIELGEKLGPKPRN